ncbi:hypothetical protein WN51_07693 [Melipona quadrifasciata]|uniref:Uncharacterized protein n=1 Tax=Melipona quadrifasciata TaxID=166423 RepID=A0A0M9A6L3_9HYME|nr:hypothetical protein WN51_07693 [Melipona quadrifasciata]
MVKLTINRRNSEIHSSRSSPRSYIYSTFIDSSLRILGDLRILSSPRILASYSIIQHQIHHYNCKKRKSELLARFKSPQKGQSSAKCQQVLRITLSMISGLLAEILLKGHWEFRLDDPFQVRRDFPRHSDWHVLEEVCKQRDDLRNPTRVILMSESLEKSKECYKAKTLRGESVSSDQSLFNIPDASKNRIVTTRINTHEISSKSVIGSSVCSLKIQNPNKKNDSNKMIMMKKTNKPAENVPTSEESSPRVASMKYDEVLLKPEQRSHLYRQEQNKILRREMKEETPWKRDQEFPKRASEEHKQASDSSEKDQQIRETNMEECLLPGHK